MVQRYRSLQELGKPADERDEKNTKGLKKKREERKEKRETTFFFFFFFFFYEGKMKIIKNKKKGRKEGRKEGEDE